MNDRLIKKSIEKLERKDVEQNRKILIMQNKAHYLNNFKIDSEDFVKI